MKLKEAIISQLVNADLFTLWENFIVLEPEDYKGFEKDLELVRFGKDVKFDITDEWSNRVIKRGSKVHAWDPFDGKKYSYPRIQYNTEMIFRKGLMRRRLYENQAIESSLIGR